MAAGLSKALGQFEEHEDHRAAELAAAEEALVVGEDRYDFEETGAANRAGRSSKVPSGGNSTPVMETGHSEGDGNELVDGNGEGEDPELLPADGEGDPEAEADGSVADYMLKFVEADWEFFISWRI